MHLVVDAPTTRASFGLPGMARRARWIKRVKWIAKDLFSDWIV
jgi:hypothetical protein